jgi:hypothetical protein
MTRHTTPILIALLSVPFLGCQELPSDSNPKADARSDASETDSADGKAEDALHTQVEPSDIDIQGPKTDETVETDTPPPAYPSLHCTTENLQPSSTPNSIRAQLLPGGAKALCAEQDATINSNPFLDPTHELTEMSGVVEGEWNDERVELTMSNTDDNGTTYFGMWLARDERAPGKMYTGLAFVNGCSAYEMTCWERLIEPEFLYNEATGECTNKNNEVGSNPWPIHMVRETGDGECTRLEGVALNEDDYGYPILEAWNLRGAVLDGAGMHFAYLLNASLEGAKMTEFEFGYAEITGSIDTHTQFPLGPCDVGYSGDLHCWN